MELKDRLKLFLREKEISQRKFELSIGKSNGYVNNIVKTIGADVLNSIKNAYPDLNINWLLSGDGEMTNSNSFETSDILAGNETISKNLNYRLVPVVHVDSVGGIYSNNEVSVTDSQYVEGYVPFVNAQEGDRAIFQTGNSMIPTCPPGSLLQIREVPNWREYFGYGNIFVIELTDGRRITKEVNRYDENPREFVWCKSHNPEVADEELPRSMINSVWKVIKILTDKGW